jgi:GTP-binding protein
MKPQRNLFSLGYKFVAGASSIEQIPKSQMPEVAFIGRSNVGKSSLINAVVMNSSCARVSKHPGRTQQINFFSIGDKISLVDLPGYGYASVSKKTRKLWDDLILYYLSERKNLRKIFMLIDSRHGIKANDAEVMDILDELAIVYHVTLTKIDKISNINSIEQSVVEQLSRRAAAFPHVILTSSEKKIGINNLRSEIISLI